MSALLNAGAARDVLVRQQLHVPHLIDSEVASSLRRRVNADQVPADQARRMLRVWQRLACTRYAVFPLLDRGWALRTTLSPSDASYVALAEFLDSTLLTADGRLARAPGPQCPITTVPH